MLTVKDGPGFYRGLSTSEIPEGYDRIQGTKDTTETAPVVRAKVYEALTKLWA